MGKQPVWHKIIKASLAVVYGNRSQNIVQCQLRQYRVEFNSSWILDTLLVLSVYLDGNNWSLVENNRQLSLE